MEKMETTGRDKIAGLFDEGTFVELGAYVRRDEDLDGVLCGYGAMEGKLVYAFWQDNGRKLGAMDAYGAKKIGRLYELAISNGAPVVGVFDSAGAVIYDGTEAMSAYGTLLSCAARASGVIPQIALIWGTCAGMAAAAAALFDFAVTIRDKSALYVGSPFLIGDKTGTSEAAAAIGLGAKECATGEEAIAFVRKLADFLPSHNADTYPDFSEEQDDVNRPVSIDGLRGAQLLDALCDNGKYLSLYDSYGTDVLTAFARIGGERVAVVACANEGKITPQVARKTARFVGFADSYSIPVLTLVDSVGTVADEKAEAAPFASELGKMARAYAEASTPKITVYTGRAYGAGFVLYGSRTLGADLLLALPGATFGVLSPEASVAFAMQDELNAGKSREELIREWTETRADAASAAAHGDVDDILQPEQLRQRICAGLYMLSDKGRAAAGKKHGNMPL